MKKEQEQYFKDFNEAINGLSKPKLFNYTAINVRMFREVLEDGRSML